MWTILIFVYHLVEINSIMMIDNFEIHHRRIVYGINICFGWLIAIGGLIFIKHLKSDDITQFYLVAIWSWTCLYLITTLFVIIVISLSIGVKWLRNRNHDNIFTIVRKFSEWKDIETNCAICLEDYGNKDLVAKLNCGHYFHQECLQLWFRKSETCPYCEQSINESRDLHATAV